MDTETLMTPARIAEGCVQALADKKGRDITVLKTDSLTVLADYFVLCTASSLPHIRTLTDETEKRLSDAGEPPIHREGYRGGGWVLLDFGSVVVHLFTEEMREFYNLERLWADAQAVDISDWIKED